MGISGDDARIQLQKLGEVDQVDKNQQQTQRGEGDTVRNRAEIEREQRKNKPTEMEKPDKLLVRQPPHRKKREDENKQAKGGDGSEDSADDKPEPDIGASLDIKA